MMNETVRTVALTYAGSYGLEECGASGIFITDDWIISHGSLLNARVTTNSSLRGFFDELQAGQLTSLPIEAKSNLKLRIFQQQYQSDKRPIKKQSTENEKALQQPRSKLLESEGSIVVAWKCPLLQNTFQDLLFSWSFDKTRKINRSLLSVFLMISLNKSAAADADEVSGACKALAKFFHSCTPTLELPQRAALVEILSTPFGNPVFIDSISCGVVSNILGEACCLMLTDANAVPGSEGAPVYVTSRDGTRRSICGMVIAPLSWCRGEWVDYTFAASLLPCLQRLLFDSNINDLQQQHNTSSSFSKSSGTKRSMCRMMIALLSRCCGEWVDNTFTASLLPSFRKLLFSNSINGLQQQHTASLSFSNVNEQLDNESDTRIADVLDKSLVLVRCGAGWGTGIILDVRTGTIITCAHVVHKAPDNPIEVVLRRADDSPSSGSSGTLSTWGRLVYRTASGKPYDVAVLTIDPCKIEPTLRSITIDDVRPVVQGEVIGSAGFPFFSSRFPTITRGYVSAISEYMLQTTCCIQSGSSGGPIVRWSTGEMLGMVVCNSISTTKSKLYPRLNMAIPASILKAPLDEWRRTGQAKVFEALETDDPSVEEIWNFQHLPSSKI